MRVRKVLEIRFTVYGIAIGKAMPRVVKGKNGQIHAFPPKHSKDWEQSVAGQAYQYRPDIPLEGPLGFGALFYRPVPKSYTKTKREQALANIILPTSKPDIKNLVANVEDALNGVFWLDDSQIVRYVDVDNIPTGKYFGETPRVEIRIVRL